jgi:hypothetical protein
MINIFGHQAVLEGENSFITIIVDGGIQHTIRHGALNFAKAVDFYIAQNWEELINVISPENYIKKLYAKYEQIEVKDGNVFVNDEVMHSLDAQRIIECLAKGADATHIFKFVIRLQKNPSSRAVQELYKFLEHKNLGISAEGTLIAYKALRNNYTDKHTGKFDNSVGNVLEMPRNKVDDDKEHGCSYGFHAGSLKYATEFASGNDRVVLVEIDPADVVSIPTDCEFQKLRTCRYKVISEFERPLEEHIPYDSSLETDDVDLREDNNDNFCFSCEWKREKLCDSCDYCNDCCECNDDDDEEECCNCSECDCCSIDCDYCNCCNECCDCGDFDADVCMGDPEEPKTEIQLELNLDNKMTSNWADARFQYLVMLPWLYAHRRPALGNALKDFYKNVDDLHNVNPIFGILKQFTSDEDAYKIYKEYTNS